MIFTVEAFRESVGGEVLANGDSVGAADIFGSGVGGIEGFGVWGIDGFGVGNIEGGIVGDDVGAEVLGAVVG